MIRFVFLLTFTFANVFIYAQDKIKVKKPVLTNAQKKARNDSIRNAYRIRSFATYDLYYGLRIFKNSFHNQLNKLDSFDTNLPVKIIGLGFSGLNYAIGPRSNIHAHMYFGYYLPAKITIADSLGSTISGGSYHLSLGKFLRIRSDKFSFAINAGFNTGLLQLKIADGTKQYNTFFSPKIGIQPKIRIWKRLLLSLFIEYEKDISKVNWQRVNKKGTLSVRGFDQTGLTSMITFGIVP